MSRHNRRRTRGGSHKKTALSHISNPNPNPYTYHSSSPLSPSSTSSSIWTPNNMSLTSNTKSFRTGVSARHWHNRYMAWLVREKRQREELARLEEEKRRIFGVISGAGPDVEEDGLCEKMLEYFGGLDFVE